MAAERKMIVYGGLLIQYRASMFLLFGYVFLACFIHEGVEGGLTLSKTCGEVSCDEHEFCSDFDKRCHKCDSVCEKSSRNFQEDVCFKDCQDYLHDRQYVRRGGDNTDDVEMLGDAVRRLTQMVIASLVIMAIILVLFSGSVCLVWRRSRRTIRGDGGEGGQADGDVASYLRGKVSSAKNPFKKDKSASAVNAANGLKLDIVVANPATQQQSNSRQTPQPQAPLPPERTSASTPRSEGGKSEATDAYSPTTTTSALSNRPPRYPSEDTTLDYAYDNRALTPSPRFDKGGNGTTGEQHPPTPYHHPQQMGLGIKGETTF